MAARLIDDHIVVSGIAPGAFPSEMNKAARDQGTAVGKSIPAGRIGIAEDMAAGAIYLASKAGDYVVGTTIPIDGGIVNASIDNDHLDPSGL
jgi:NAD(P)-dependent dehydrogenase (short-subunit alcohol dehydrogenase family)